MPWLPSEEERRRLVEAGGTVVANLKTDTNLIAWAKKAGKFVRICRPTKWGNPFVIGRDGDRDKVLKQFKAYLKQEAMLRKEVTNLKGKVLGCWCYPEPCHGDQLIRLIEAGT
jgi:hypothetical protein